MKIRFALLALLGALAVFTTACVVPGGGDDTEVATDDDNTTDDNTTNDDPPAEDPPADDDTGTDVADGDLPEIDLPDGMTEEEGQVAVASAIAGDVPPEVEDCVTRSLFSEPGLFIALIGQGENFVLTDLPFDDQVTLGEITIDCAGPELMGQFVAEGFAEGSDLEAPPEMIDCFERRFVADDGALVFVGMAAVGEEVTPEEPAQEPLIAALTECVSGSFLANAIVDDLAAEDPTFAESIDAECVDSAYAADPDIIRPLWTEFVLNPQSEFTDVSPTVTTSVFSPLFGCLSFGKVIEAQVPDLELSESTIDCIDTRMAELGFFETLLAGEEPDEAALQTVLLDCLTAEELLQLAGS
ncbi:MAG: hypothetical protein AAGK32_03155 [Actinomycetota bacterium]